MIEEQTQLAQRQAELAGRRLEAEVRRPADAEAYRKRALAEAERDQTKFTADAEAYRTTTIAAAEAEATKTRADAAAYSERAKASADADANTARAGSLKGGNQELIAADRIVESLPSLVGAAADGIAESNLTIFNGAEGVSQVIAGVVGQGLSILETLKRSTAAAGRKDTEPVLRAEVTEPALAAVAGPAREATPAPEATAAEPAPAATPAEPARAATAAEPAPALVSGGEVGARAVRGSGPRTR